MVACWRGIWDSSAVWLEKELWAGNLTAANISALLFGLSITSCIDLLHGTAARAAAGRWWAGAARAAWSLVWGLADILLWKGLWDGVDHWAGWGCAQATATLAIGITGLTLSRTLRSAHSMPVGIVVDTDEQISCDTALGAGPGASWPRRVADCLASRAVECGVVLLWHGLWSLTDITTEGEDWLELSHAHSALLSLLLGWGGGAALFLSQFSLLRLNTQHSPAFLLLFWLFLLAGAAATISRDDTILENLSWNRRTSGWNLADPFSFFYPNP